MRFSWIDYAKVICIFLMVICHAGLKEGMACSLIYQFHMPAFFIISGYLYRPKGLKKEMLAFGVPITVWGGVSLIYRFVRSFLSSGLHLSDALDVWTPVAQSGLSSLYIASHPSLFQGCWFVIVLWMMRLVMESEILRHFKYCVLIICVLWSSAEPLWNLPEMIYDLRVYHLLSAFPFFITGIILKEKNLNISRGSFEFKISLIFVFFALGMIQGMVDLYKYDFGWNYMLFYINAIIGSYLLFNICNALPVGKQWVETLSIGTLLILGIHGIIFNLISDCLEHFGFTNIYLSVFVGLVVMAVCYYPIKWLNRKSPILLGKIH